jgi:hypothetical protein
MKLRFTLMILAALLLTAVAGASPAPATSPAAPAVSSSAPVTSAVAEPETCDSNLAIFSLAGLTPAPSPRTGARCGSCGTSPCLGGTTGELCGFRNGLYGYCQSPLGDTCSDGFLKCQCWFGPLP